jgi:hypothetical protein
LFGEYGVTGYRSKVNGVKNQVGKRTLRKTTHRPAYIEWRSLRRLGRPYPGKWQSIVDAKAATKSGLAIPEHVIGKADARFEIAQSRIAREEFFHVDDWPTIEIEYRGKLVVRLGRYRADLIAQPQV